MDILALIPQFGGAVWMIAAFIVAISVIVAIHEYGHYIVGRWSGIHADVFSLGFGPVLYSRFDKRGTRWQIAALPFGGYVKFAGDANAASGKDVDAMAAAEADPVRLRATMHGAPLWARTATVAAGPIFNFILSIIIFASVLTISGVSGDQLTVGELRPMPTQERELEAGDQIIAINGAAIPDREDADAFAAFFDDIPHTELLNYTVLRGDDEVEVTDTQLLPPLVTRVGPRSAGLRAGLEAGDVIIGVDGTPIVAFDELKAAVEGGNGNPLALTVWRAGQEIDITLSPKRVDEPQPEGGFATQWRIGIAGGYAFEPGTQNIGVIEAVSAGVRQTGQIISGSLSGLAHMALGKISSCNLSGPIGIAQASGTIASQGLDDFIWFIAVLSTAVGLLNLFPVPMLDGGHLVFYAYEAVTGKPPTDGALKILMTVGMVLVLSLMIFGLGNDLFCP